MLVVIDHRDSFTFNLVDLVTQAGIDVRVLRSDEATVDDVVSLSPTRIILSPGPGHPADASLARWVAGGGMPDVPVLGVCLGMQCIVAAAGGRVVPLSERVHGRASLISHDARGIFAGLSSPLTAARYHSLVACPRTMPDELEITARTEDGLIMGVRHRTRPIEGVQFHPESILTGRGAAMIERFVTRPHRPARKAA